MEFRKDVKNRYFIYYLATVIICFVLGYVLLVSLDKISKYRAFYIQSWEGLHCQKDFFQSIPNEQLA